MTLGGRLRGAALAAALLAIALPAAVFAHADVDELKSEADAAVALRPHDPLAHLDRARVLRVAGDWDAALAALDAAAARGADAEEVDAIRASVLLDAHRPQPALREIDRILARRPDRYGVVFERGRALLMLGRAAQAEQEFGRAIAAMPSPKPEHVFVRRDALLALDRPEAALAALDAGMVRIGPVAALQLAALDIEVQLARLDAALDRIDALIGPDGHNPAWIARRGEILQRAGRNAEAQVEYERALALIDGGSNGRRGKAFGELRSRLLTVLDAAP
jgi:tetratricopeptide (TPR) repeat protein